MARIKMKNSSTMTIKAAAHPIRARSKSSDFVGLLGVFIGPDWVEIDPGKDPKVYSAAISDGRIEFEVIK